MAFSLDLRDGKPVANDDSQIGSDQSPEEIAKRAALAGARAVIVIDLARVGTGSGIACHLLD